MKKFARLFSALVFCVVLFSGTAQAQLATGTVDFDVDTLRDQTQVTISLSDNSTLVLLRDYVVDDGPGKYTWIGFVQDDVNGRAFITVNAPNAVGTIHTSTKSYRLTVTEAAAEPVQELDPSSFPPEAEPLLPPIFSHGFEDDAQQSAFESPTAACDDTPAGIDVLVLYSDDAAAASTDIQAEIRHAVKMANTNFLDSHIKPGDPGGIKLGLNLVHTQMLQINENTPVTSDQLLDDLTAGQGEFLAVPGLRDQYAADLVILILEAPDNCGQAHMSHWLGKGNEKNAFGYVERDCIHQYTFSHEVGHLFGAHHDKFAILIGNSPLPLPDPSRPIYGYSYLGPGVPWRTVMAYDVECIATGFNYCPRLGFFSSPDFIHAGTPTGVAGTDNRKQLIDAAPDLACYRPRPRISVQKLNQADGSPTTEGLVESSGSSVAPAISCGATCAGGAAAGSTVILTAKDQGDWKFVRWSEGGVCAGSTSPLCGFTVTGNQLARPEFTPPVTLTVQKVNQAGGGAVAQGLVKSTSGNITPAIDCGSVCQGTAIVGTQVQLIASDTGNWRFTSWGSGGVCAGSTSPECSFVVDSNKTAKAEFFEDDFAFEVAEYYYPWDLQNPRLNCVHYEGEYQITGYYASFDRCYSNMDAVIRCVGTGCSASRFKVALIKVFWSGTVVGRGADCNSYQDFLGPGSGQIYPDSPGWHELGQGWTRTGFTSELSPLVNGSFVFQNFRWIGADPGVPCSGNDIKTMEVEFNVYDVATGIYTVIPFVMTVP